MANQLTLNNTALEEIKVFAASLPTANTIELDTTLTQSGMAADAKAVRDYVDSKQIITDDTLTQSGQAADAKATGDRLAQKANQSLSATLTVLASAWTGEEAPYTATVACSVATANNNIVVGSGNVLTDEELAAYAAAVVNCIAQADGAITLEAKGEKPTIDLPVNVLVVG